MAVRYRQSVYLDRCLIATPRLHADHDTTTSFGARIAVTANEGDAFIYRNRRSVVGAGHRLDDCPIWGTIQTERRLPHQGRWWEGCFRQEPRSRGRGTDDA